MTWWGNSPKLGRDARALLERSSEAMFVSPVSVWEIANKNRLRKLPEFDGFAEQFAPLCHENGFTMLDLTALHALRAGYLSGVHRDPFDRLIAGQALVEDMPVITNDPEIAAFGCKVLW